MKILAVIPTLSDDPTETINTLKLQNNPVSKILIGIGSKKLFRKLSSQNFKKTQLIHVEPDFSQNLGARIGKAINEVLKGVALDDYDYLLKIDADTTLPANFIAANIKTNSDLTGIFGFAMLLKTSPFLTLLNGKWPEVLGEDTYIVHSYQRAGYSISNYLLPPTITRKTNFHSWKYYFNRGFAMYKLGYEPLHTIALSSDIREDRNTLFIIPGFISAIVKKELRYEFASWIFKEQLKELINPVKLFAHSRVTFF